MSNGRLSAVFDLDGTLWDTSDAILPVWNYVLSKYSDKVITKKEMGSYMGKTLDEIADMMIPGGNHQKTLEIINECCKAEQIELRKKGARIYPDVISVLNKLKEKYSIYIVSNCEDGYLQCFLDFYDLNGLFSDFEMSGRTGLSKAENIKLIIQRNGIEKAVYIGDTQSDFTAARQAEIPFIFAAYGFGTVENPHYRIDRFVEIINVLCELE